MKNFEEKLPENYKLAEIISMKNNRLGILMNILTLLIAIVLISIFCFFTGTPIIVKEYLHILQNNDAKYNEFLFRLMIMLITLVSYFLVFALFTFLLIKIIIRSKIKISVSLTIATIYCDMFIRKKLYILIAILNASLVQIPFIIALFLFPKYSFEIYFGLSFMLANSCTSIMRLYKLKKYNKTTYIRDVKVTFEVYTKSS